MSGDDPPLAIDLPEQPRKLSKLDANWRSSAMLLINSEGDDKA